MHPTRQAPQRLGQGEGLPLPLFSCLWEAIDVTIARVQAQAAARTNLLQVKISSELTQDRWNGRAYIRDVVSAIAVRTQTAPGKSRQIFKKVDVRTVAVEVNRRTIAL